MRAAIAGSALTVCCLLSLGACRPATAAPASVLRGFGNRGIVEIEASGAGPVPSDLAAGRDGEAFVLGDSRGACSGSRPCGGLVVQGYLRSGKPDAGFHADLGFGASGVSSTAMVVDGHGRVLVAAATAGRIAVVRLARDGRLDSSFGEGGRVSLQADGSLERPQLAIAANGGAIVASRVQRPYGFRSIGEPPGNDSYLALYRLGPNGSPDARFGSGGVVAFDSPRGDELSSLAVVGREIVLAVAVEPPCCGLRESRLLRYDATGRLLAIRRVPPDRAVDPLEGPVITRHSGGAWVGGGDGSGATFTAFRRDWKRARRIGAGGSVHLHALTPARVVEDRAGRLLVLGKIEGRDASGYRRRRLVLARRRADGRVDRTFAGGRPLRVRFPFSGTKAVIALGLTVRSDGAIEVLLMSYDKCVRSCSSAGTDYYLLAYRGGTMRR